MTDNTTYSLISADSDVVEPPDLFSSRLPADLRDRAPKLRPAAAALGCRRLRHRAAAAQRGNRFGLPDSVRRNGKPITFDEVLPARSIRRRGSKLKTATASTPKSCIRHPTCGTRSSASRTAISGSPARGPTTTGSPISAAQPRPPDRAGENPRPPVRGRLRGVGPLRRRTESARRCS